MDMPSPMTRDDKDDLLKWLRRYSDSAPQIMGHDLRKPKTVEQDGTSGYRYMTPAFYEFLRSPILTFKAIRHQIILLFLDLTIRNPTGPTFRMMTGMLLMVMRDRRDATEISLNEKLEIYKK